MKVLIDTPSYDYSGVALSSKAGLVDSWPAPLVSLIIKK